MLCRLYESSDRDACVRAFSSNVPTLFLPEERIAFEQFLDRLPGPYFVVIEDGELTGCGGYAIERGPDEAEIRWIMVHRDHHGQGAGDLLMTASVSELLPLADCQSVRLATSQYARRFFERWRFSVVNVAPNGIGPGLDRVEMRLLLDEPARRHWHEMITGGLTPPDIEQPIPVIEHYKEWIAHRYAPGHYLGGNLEPHLDQTRIGPKGKRLCGLLLGISALESTIGMAAFGVDYGPAEAAGYVVIGVVMWTAAIRMYLKGNSTAASDPEDG